LCLFCFLWIILITAGFFLPFIVLFSAIGLGVALMILLLFLSVLRKRKQKDGVCGTVIGRRTSAAALLLTLPLLAMAAYRSFYADAFHFYAAESSLEMSGRVYAVSYASDYGSCYYVQTETLNGNNEKLKVMLTVDSASLLHVGDVIEAEGIPALLSSETSLTERLTYAADGIVGSIQIDDSSMVTVTSVGHTTFSDRWLAVNNAAAQRLLEACGKKQGGLISAVLLGRKDLLSDSIERDFARCGLSHVLALSGFHVSVLAGGMDFFLKKCRIGRGIRMAVSSLLLFLFLCLTGFSLSALRSVMMIFILFCSRWLFAESDTPTFLTLTVAGMMTFFPACAVDVSLWMSFAATFGVLLGVAFLQKMPKAKGIIGSIGEKIISGITISLFAIVCVLPLSFLYFGAVSVAAPITTLAAVPLTYVLMIGGLVTLCTSIVAGPLAAQAVGIIPEFSGRLLTGLVNRVSAMNGIVYSLKYSFVPIVMIFLLILFLLWTVFRWEKKWMIVIPVVCTVCLYGVCLSVWRDEANGHVAVSYLSRNSADTLLLSHADDSILIHIGNGAYSDLREGWRALEETGNTELSALLLTHYHTAEIGSFERLASRVVIRRLILPEPTTEAEYFVLAGLCEKAQAEGVPVYIFHNGEEMILWEGGGLTVYNGAVSRSSHPVTAVSVIGSNGKFVYLGSSAAEGITDCRELTADCTCLLLGAHGPSPKQMLDGSAPLCQTLIIPNSGTVTQISDAFIQSLPADCTVFLDTFWWNGTPISLDNKDGAVIQ